MDALRREDFGLAQHRYQQFDATVSAQLTDAQLEDPTLWVNVAAKMNPGDEIRVRADDDSFVALLHVTYSVGTRVRVKMVYRSKLEVVDYSKEPNIAGVYEVKQRGVKKWCLMEVATGKCIEELIPTQALAYKALEDLQRAMAA